MTDALRMGNMPGSTGSILTGDMETFTNHFRNPIHFLATGLALTDSFRVEVKVTYEYIPTTIFRMWAPVTTERAHNDDAS